MKIYYDLHRIGMEDTIHILQRALTFVYMDELLEPEIKFVTGVFHIVYEIRNINIAIDLSMMELEYLNITLEQFSLDMKKQVITKYRDEIDKKEEV